MLPIDSYLSHEQESQEPFLNLKLDKVVRLLGIIDVQNQTKYEQPLHLLMPLWRLLYWLWICYNLFTSTGIELWILSILGSIAKNFYILVVKLYILDRVRYHNTQLWL